MKEHCYELALVSALVTKGDENLLNLALEKILKRQGCCTEHGDSAHTAWLQRVAEFEEIILQCYLFAGYPRAINGFIVFRQVLSHCPNCTQNHYLQTECGGLESYDQWPQWLRRGQDLCNIVYGGKYQRLVNNITQLHADLSQWMLIEGYGKVLSRPILDLRLRELAVIASLTVQGSMRQLHSHILGAIYAGATFFEIEKVLAVIKAHCESNSFSQAMDLVKNLKWKEIQKNEVVERCN